MGTDRKTHTLRVLLGDGPSYMLRNMRKGARIERLRSIRTVMKIMCVSCERAMDLLEVPEGVREELVCQLK